MCRLIDWQFQMRFITEKIAFLQYSNKFLYVNITILMFEFLKKEFCYIFLKHMFREIHQIFWNTISDFRSNSRNNF